MSGNNTQNAAIPDKHHIELVAVSARDRNGQGAKMGIKVCHLNSSVRLEVHADIVSCQGIAITHREIG
jgi:hypothetical protein